MAIELGIILLRYQGIYVRNYNIIDTLYELETSEWKCSLFKHMQKYWHVDWHVYHEKNIKFMKIWHVRHFLWEARGMAIREGPLAIPIGIHKKCLKLQIFINFHFLRGTHGSQRVNSRSSNYFLISNLRFIWGPHFTWTQKICRPKKFSYKIRLWCTQ